LRLAQQLATHRKLAGGAFRGDVPRLHH
jgi:hypothetical protein